MDGWRHIIKINLSFGDFSAHFHDKCFSKPSFLIKLYTAVMQSLGAQTVGLYFSCEY